MSETFLRVDLRDSTQGRARDFRKVALQPGVPLLDPANTNYRMLRKWFGVCVAQPEFRADQPDSVGFCVCDEQERRIVNVRCKPITENDLKSRSEIARQFDELKSKIQTLQPDNPKEATLLNAVRSHFNNLTSNPGNLGFSFFRYKTGSRWQLVWLWGFERRDSGPASAEVCKRESCRHLVARRVGEKPRCPVCQGIPTPFPKSREAWRFSRLLLFLLFLLGLLAGGFFAFFRNFDSSLIATKSTYAVWTVPELEEPWKIPVGGRLKYRIIRFDCEQNEDITDRVDVMVADPQTARIDRASRYLRAWSVGETTVSFHLDQEEIRTIPLTVLEPTMPAALRLEPEDVTLGIGSTRQLTLLGQYDDNRTIDLTEAALWKPNSSPVVSSVLGQIEGLEEGKTEIEASYTVGENIRDASCRVEVVPENYTAIELRGVPERLYENFASLIEVVTKNEKGEERILTRSPRLRFDIEPPEAAFMENGNLLTALSSGKATLRARYETISGETLETATDFEVVRDETASHFLVRPDELKLAVGESVLLDVLPRGPDAVHGESGDESVVELLDGNRAVGRKPGKTSIVLSQNNVRKEIPVEVSEVDWESIAFSPDQVFVAVDHAVPLRLFGTGRDGKRREISPDQIVWETEPDPDFVRIDSSSLDAVGLKPTGHRPLTARARFADRTAGVRIEVLSAPLRLELSPTGPVELPVDQQIRFSVLADYGDGPVAIAPDRILWSVKPESLPEGVVWEPARGVLKAEKAGLGPIEISAFYQGETTKSSQVKTVESVPVEIDVNADKPSLSVNEQSDVRITLKNSSSPTVPIPEKYVFKPASNALKVDPKTGRYIGTEPGKSGVIVTHPTVKGDVSVPIEVVGPEKPRLEIRPDKIVLEVGETAVLTLVKIDGDREETIPLVRTGEPRLTSTHSAAARIRLPDRILGVKPAPPFQLFATHQGMKATASVEVKPRQLGNRPKSRNTVSPKQGTSTSKSGSGLSSGSGAATGTNTGRSGSGGSSAGNTTATTTDSATPKLVLEGPEWITVGSEAVFTVTLDDRDVTMDHSSLVLDPESEEFAVAKYGCELQAKKPGTVTVRARRFTRFSDPIRVEIRPHAEEPDKPFHNVSLDRSTNVLADGRFQVYVNVEAIVKDRELEYRIAPLDEKAEPAWVPLETDEDGRQRVRLASPELRGGDVDERHHLTIEARDKKNNRIERHPFDFRIKGKTIEVE